MISTYGRAFYYRDETAREEEREGPAARIHCFVRPKRIAQFKLCSRCGNEDTRAAPIAERASRAHATSFKRAHHRPPRLKLAPVADFDKKK